MRYRKILIAVDNSANALEAVKHGFELAGALGAELALVSVVPPAEIVSIPEAGVVIAEPFDSHAKEADEAINKIFELYPNAKCSVHKPFGSAKKEILKIANECGADLIVMGTHGRTGIDYFLMGSVAEYVLKHAKQPVLVVKS